MANSNNHLRSFLFPKLWQLCQSNDEDENEETNFRYELVTGFNTLQQHVAQHLLQYPRLPASFNKLILTDIRRVDGS